MTDALLHARPSGAAARRAAAPTDTQRRLRLEFAIWRDGAEIGWERVHVERAGDLQTVRTRTEAAIRLGFVPVFRFAHSATETWRNGQLEGLQARTDDDGVLHYLSVARAGRRLIVAVDGRRSEVPFGIVPASLWTARVAGQAVLLNTRDGRPMPASTDLRGGGPAGSLGVTLDGGVARELWYDGDGLLRRQRFTARDGSEILFERRL